MPNEKIHNAIYRADPGIMANIRRLWYLKQAGLGHRITLVEYINEILAAHVEAHKITLTGGGK